MPEPQHPFLWLTTDWYTLYQKVRIMWKYLNELDPNWYNHTLKLYFYIRHEVIISKLLYCESNLKNMDRCIDLEDRGVMTPAGRHAFEKGVIYQFTPVISSVAETSLFCHSERSEESAQSVTMEVCYLSFCILLSQTGKMVRSLFDCVIRSYANALPLIRGSDYL